MEEGRKDQEIRKEKERERARQEVRVVSYFMINCDIRLITCMIKRWIEMIIYSSNINVALITIISMKFEQRHGGGGYRKSKRRRQ